MICVKTKSDVLNETKNKMDVGIHVTCDIEGPVVLLEVELYKILKEFEKQIPQVWADALERVITDTLEGDEEE